MGGWGATCGGKDQPSGGGIPLSLNLGIGRSIIKGKEFLGGYSPRAFGVWTYGCLGEQVPVIQVEKWWGAKDFVQECALVGQGAKRLIN